jgi:hypothetical protein
MPMSDEPLGLFNKYYVNKVDGSPTDPEAVYFVLRLDTDPNARRVALVYSNIVEETNPKMADDLRRMIYSMMEFPDDYEVSFDKGSDDE